MKTLVLAVLLAFSVVTTSQAEHAPLSVLSYNVWGVPFAGKKAGKRIPEIGQRLAPQTIDIVTLQEAFEGCFVPNEPKLLLQNSGYPYFAKGAGPRGLRCVSSGLVILSKHPILESATVVFDHCSGVDCFARKGALYVKIAVPGIGEVDVYTTHTNAGDSGKAASKRVTQVEQLIQFVDQHSGDGLRPVIFTGDLNAAPQSAELMRLRSALGLRDSHEEFVHHNTVSEVERNGYTSDPRRNGNKTFADVDGARIDYVFFREPRNAGSTALTAARSALSFVEPGYRGLPLSDHFGVLSALDIDL